MAEKAKFDTYQMITDKIIAQLEKGVVPWHMPWNAAVNRPRYINGRRYTGINVFLLLSQGYASPWWMTYKEAERRGGTVKKGEKATYVVFWKIINKEDTNELGQRVKKTIPLLRYYRVFNLEQTEGVKLPKAVEEQIAQAEDHDFESNLDAEMIVKGYVDGPEIREAGMRAYYLPHDDIVYVPPRSTFDTPDDFYATLFHELGHSTGHEKRLARKFGGRFGDHAYGREELVAEMTAAFLAAEAGIEKTLKSNASYLGSWIKTLREDVKAVVVAAGAAQKAADLILGHTDEEDHEGE